MSDKPVAEMSFDAFGKRLPGAIYLLDPVGELRISEELCTSSGLLYKWRQDVKGATGRTVFRRGLVQ